MENIFNKIFINKSTLEYNILYNILNSKYIQIIVNITLPTIATISLSISNKLWSLFYASTFIYILFCCLFHWISIKNKENIKNIKLYKDIIYKNSCIIQIVSKSCYHVSQKFKSNLVIDYDNIRDILNFQDCANIICMYIYDLIFDILKTKKINVTVLQKFNDVRKSYITITAFKDPNSNVVDNFGVPYYLNDASNSSLCQVNIFKTNNQNYVILDQNEIIGKELIKSFKEDENKRLQMYIGVPAKGYRNEIAFVTQIEIYDNILVNIDDKIVSFIIENIVNPYIRIMLLLYETEHVIQSYHNLINLMQVRGDIDGQEKETSSEQ